jgi:hypothetical protein
MENLMFAVGFISQWAKANPKVPNILVVLGVCAIGYLGYWVTDEAALAHGVRGFLNGGFEWALKGVFALQGTSAAASGLSGLNLPAGMANALPVTKN